MSLSIYHVTEFTGVNLPSKADLNQHDIVKALRSIGASVHITNQVGDGFPDIVVGWFGKNYLFEIKNNQANGKLNTTQFKFHERWKGSVHIIWTPQDAFAILGVR